MHGEVQQLKGLIKQYRRRVKELEVVCLRNKLRAEWLEDLIELGGGEIRLGRAHYRVTSTPVSGFSQQAAMNDHENALPWRRMMWFQQTAISAVSSVHSQSTDQPKRTQTLAAPFRFFAHQQLRRTVGCDGAVARLVIADRVLAIDAYIHACLDFAFASRAVAGCSILSRGSCHGSGRHQGTRRAEIRAVLPWRAIICDSDAHASTRDAVKKQRLKNDTRASTIQ